MASNQMIRGIHNIQSLEPIRSKLSRKVLQFPSHHYELILTIFSTNFYIFSRLLISNILHL